MSTMKQTDRTMQEYRTSLSPAETLAEAKAFFARRNNIYSVFPDREGPTFVTFRGQGGEELVIGVASTDGGTLVTGSTYLFDMQIARFLASLPPAAGASGVPSPAASMAPEVS
jgi:hypothetical protein